MAKKTENVNVSEESAEAATRVLRPWTEAEIAKAQKMRADGETWDAIDTALNRSRGGSRAKLRSLEKRRKRGPGRPRRDGSPARGRRPTQAPAATVTVTLRGDEGALGRALLALRAAGVAFSVEG